MIDFTIETRGALRQIQTLTADLTDAIDPEEILDQASSTILSRTIRRFRNQTTPDGRRWEVSEASRIRARGGYTISGIRRRKATGGNTLFATGDLFRSFDLIDDGNGQRRIINNAPYAIYLNTVDNGKWQFLGAGEQDIQLFLNIVQDRIARALS
ncbi:neck protein [Vibrio phage D4]|nr:neck protein [Vibrio phage vB_VcaS_HC]UHD87322.1 neck protein [Vibrio phage D4]WKV32822.1 neck protein [Vibrio phage vB_VhaS_R21Y]